MANREWDRCLGNFAENVFWNGNLYIIFKVKELEYDGLFMKSEFILKKILYCASFMGSREILKKWLILTFYLIRLRKITFYICANYIEVFLLKQFQYFRKKWKKVEQDVFVIMSSLSIYDSCTNSKHSFFKFFWLQLSPNSF